MKVARQLLAVSWSMLPTWVHNSRKCCKGLTQQRKSSQVLRLLHTYVVARHILTRFEIVASDTTKQILISLEIVAYV